MRRITVGCWLRKLTRRVPEARVRARPRSLRLWLEQLEERWVPAILWDGGTDGTGTVWGTAVNWVGDVLPGVNDDVEIGAAFSGVAITSTGTVSIKSLTSAAPLTISGGSLTLANASAINNAFTLSSGTLTGVGTLSVSGLLTWTGGAMTGTGATNANGDLLLSGSSTRTLSQRKLNNAGTAT